GGDRGALGAGPERIRGVLDVDALELAPVAGAHDGADEVSRVRRVGARGRGLGPLDEIRAHRASWKSVSVVRDPSSAPSTTSSVEWTPDSTRVCATSNAITNAIDETTKRRSLPAAYVTPTQAANAIAAWPEGRPPRSGVPRPVHAFAAITPTMVIASATSVRTAGASRARSSRCPDRALTRCEKTRNPTATAFRAAISTAPAATSLASFAIGSNDVVATSIAPSIAELIISAIRTIFETATTSARTMTPIPTTKWIRMFRCVRRTWMIPSNA